MAGSPTMARSRSTMGTTRRPRCGPQPSPGPSTPCWVSFVVGMAPWRARERNYKAIIDTIPALAWSALPDGFADFFNQHYLDYVGLTQEELKDHGWQVVVHRDDLPSAVTTWQRIMASETSGEAEVRLRRFDGEHRWFLIRVNPLRDQAGRIVKWYGINTDI